MTQTIVSALLEASQKLKTLTDVPNLEAEILLAHVLQVSRSYLHTWPERFLDSSQFKQFLSLIDQRVMGAPIAYLIGHREFWSLDLIVTPDVLIPRPETELLVELALQLVKTEQAVVADLGTGSGAIALSLAQEKPQWHVIATDKSVAALNVAKQNAQRLQLSHVQFYQGSWCEALPSILFDAIVSNPPYIAKDDQHLTEGDLRFEPQSALVSNERGLEDLHQIILQARDFLKPGGYLMLEHGWEQAKDVATFFLKADYNLITRYRDFSGLDRVTIATK